MRLAPDFLFLLVCLFLFPTAATAIFDAIGDFFGSVCLGRANIFYYISGIPLLINLITYHTLAGILGYESGDYTTRAPLICEVLYGSVESASIEMGRMVSLLDEGSAKRGNSLGYLRLSPKPFTCYDDPTLYSDGYCGIGLGMPHADHSKIRPFLDQVLGEGNPLVPWGESGNFWSLTELQTAAQQYLAGRDSLVVGFDPGNFFLIEIHRRMLGIELTEEEASTLQTFMDDSLFDAVFPQIPIVTDSRQRRADRAVYIDMYVQAIEARIVSGIITTLDMADARLAANAFMDAMTFAAIPSLTGGVAAVVGVYLHNIGNVNNELNWDEPNDLGRAIMEAVRSYPPVLGVPYLKDNTRFESVVGYTGYDETVFGSDARDYRVRFATVNQYRDLLVNWADKAFPVVGKPETSHVCPARSLSFNLLFAFLSQLDITSWMEGEGGKPTVQPSGSGPTFWGTISNPNYNIVKIV